jgi:hypothetical protein
MPYKTFQGSLDAATLRVGVVVSMASLLSNWLRAR